MAAGIFRKLSYFLDAFLIALLLWSAWNAQLVVYGIDQARGQLHIVLNTRDVNDVLADTSVKDSTKAKLRFLAVVKQFAIDSLGLEPTENYTTYFEQHGKPILWVLTASQRFALKPFEWKFPLLGTVSYKGFFDYKKGKRAEQELKGLGFDTDLDDVTAWSTLGYFRDPVLSGMLNRHDGALAELILHEMTHGTLYLASSVNFNENFASVIGEEGAKQFLQVSGRTADLEEYTARLTDYEIYSRYMIASAGRLDSLYNIIRGEDWEKDKQKRAMMESIAQGIDSLPFRNPEKFRKIFANSLPNNTYFLAFRRYDAQKDSLRRELQEKFNGNIREYILYMKSK